MWSVTFRDIMRAGEGGGAGQGRARYQHITSIDSVDCEKRTVIQDTRLCICLSILTRGRVGVGQGKAGQGRARQGWAGAGQGRVGTRYQYITSIDSVDCENRTVIQDTRLCICLSILTRGSTSSRNACNTESKIQ